MSAEARSAARPGRLTPLCYEQLDTEQARLWDGLAAGPRGAKAIRPEGNLTGPFDVLLRAPAVGRVLDDLGAVLRFGSHLSRRHLELVIVVTAARWRAGFAWVPHAEYAREEGLSDEAIAAVAAGSEPELELEEDRVVYDFAEQLVRTGRVSDDGYRAAVSLLGETALVELVALAGYYSLESLVLNAFEVPLPEGRSVPWEDEEASERR